MKVEVKNALFYYDKLKVLFKNLSFNLEDGQILAILGPNGVGKTSLLRCLCGFEKFRKGSVFIDGNDIKNISIKDFWKDVSYIPQKSFSAFDYTGIEMVVFGKSVDLDFYNKPNKKDYKEAYDLMLKLDIAYLSNKNISQMSGGELQMIIIARSLIKKPKLLILDEVESGLDFKNQLKILDLIFSMSETEKTTVIFNTHYPDHALRIADKSLLLMSDGYLFGDSDNIISEANIQRAFGVKIKILQIEINGKILKTVKPVEISK